MNKNLPVLLPKNNTSGGLHMYNYVNLSRSLPTKRGGKPDRRFKNKNICLDCNRDYLRCNSNYKKLYQLTELLVQSHWIHDKDNEKSFLTATGLKKNRSSFLLISEKDFQKTVAKAITSAKYLVFPLLLKNGIIAHRVIYYLANDLNKEQRNHAFLFRWLVLKKKEQLQQLLHLGFGKFKKKIEEIKWQMQIIEKYTNSRNLVGLIGNNTNDKKLQKTPCKESWGWNNKDYRERKSIVALLCQGKNRNLPNSKVSGVVGVKNEFLPTLDIDRKNFGSRKWKIFEKKVLPKLIFEARNYLAWIEKSLNGGYHLVFKSKEGFASIDKSFWWQGKNRGELRCQNVYTVLGISQGYEMFNPELFLYEKGLLKRKPSLKQITEPKPINQIWLTILLSQFEINLHKPSEQIHPLFSAKQQNHKLIKNIKFNFNAREKSRQKVESIISEKQQEKIFSETKKDNSDPPSDYPSEKVSEFSQKVNKKTPKSQKFTFSAMAKDFREVERLSSSNSSRSNLFLNLTLEYISPQLTLQKMNVLINIGSSHNSAKTWKRILDNRGQPIELTIQTMTDHRGTANFIC